MKLRSEPQKTKKQVMKVNSQLALFDLLLFSEAFENHLFNYTIGVLQPIFNLLWSLCHLYTGVV